MSEAIYLELHPETAPGAVGRAGYQEKDGQVVHSFADATAAVTGSDARTVRRDAATPQKRWNDANQEARKAHGYVARAIKRGEMERRPCVVCGNPKVDMHHPDPANQPLWAIPLCRTHHMRLHAELRRREKAGANG